MPKVKVAKLHELGENSMRQVSANGVEVLLVRTAGQVRALGAHCPHQGAPLAEGLLAGGRVHCPWHQSVFDASNGDLLEPPTLDCLPVYPVEVAHGEVLVEVPEVSAATRSPEMVGADPGADSRSFVILGGGGAGLAAAQELRRAGFRGRVVLVSADERRPYERTHCSKDYLAGNAPADWLPLKPDSFYEDAGVEWVQHRVERVDLAARRVSLPGGAAINADALLLATGGEPRRLQVPGSDLEGVVALRTWDDSDRLAAAADGAERVVVIGASFIGMEVAASLKERGVASVTVVAPEAVPFKRALGERVGGVVRALHIEHGVRFALGSPPARIEGSGRVEAVVTEDGSRVPADLVVAGIGVRPATDAIAGVRLESDGSLRTDERLQVAEGVWAAGDIATFPDWRSGEPIRIEHWRVALQQGMTAARNMAGAGEPFRAVPFFWTMHFGNPLVHLGYAARWDEEIVHGSLEDHDFMVYYLGVDKVLAAAAMGRDRQVSALHDLMLAGREPSADEVREGAIDLVARLRG